MARVLVDVDDTLAGTMAVLLAYVNGRASRRYEYEELTREFRERNEGEYYELVQEVLRDGDDLRVPPLDRALSGVRKLHENGHEVHIVSARRENLHSLTREWLREHGFEPYVTDTHPRPSRLSGTDFKRGVARRLNADAAFDDTFELTKALAAIVPVVYLIDNPWNREEGLPDSVVRVPSFADGVDRFLGA